jgi:hypothetical protein
MSTLIEITCAAPLQNTPVFIALPPEKRPKGSVVLQPERGAFIPAQAVEGGVVALLTLQGGATARFALQRIEELPRGVELIEGDGTLEIALPDSPFGTYHYANTPRPYVWPLRGSDGVQLTRAYPMENREGEMHDHPHHRSLWSAFDEVSGVNNWHEGEGHGYTRHEAFLARESGPVCAGFTSQNRWESSIGEPILTELRTLRVYNVDGAARLFDYDIEWRADYHDVTFGDTKEAGSIAVRVATSMDGSRGGVILNSRGGVGEKECWGQVAEWCDYSGNVGECIHGITIFNRPDSDVPLPRWHVRDYGLFAVNPFSQAAFIGGENKPFVLQNGQSVKLKYRVLLHSSDAEKARVADVWQTLSNPPRIEVKETL